MDTLIAFLLTLIILDAFVGFILYRRIVKTCMKGVQLLSGYSGHEYAEVETRKVMRNRKLWKVIALGVAVTAFVIIYRSRFAKY